MKIVDVSVKSFGKLHDVGLSFRGGVNVVRNSNAFGKTTLASFVRAMLYGLNYGYTKTNDERINDVVRFAPWGGSGKFGGSMTVEHNGERYRIERFFGSTAKAENLVVTNCANGKTLNLGMQPGEYFLGLTVDSYDRSTYFPQEAVELHGNENLESKLANLVDSADYDKVQEKLLAYRRAKRAARGDGGSINRLEGEVFTLRKKLNEAAAAEEQQRRYARQVEQYTLQLNDLNHTKCDVKARLDDVNRRIAESRPSDEQLQTEGRLRECKLQLASWPNGIDVDRKTLDGIAVQLDRAVSESVTTPVKQPKSHTNAFLFVLAALLLVSGIVLAVVVNTVAGLSVAAAGVIFAVVAFWLRKTDVKKASQKKRCAESDKTQQVEQLASDYLGIASKYVNITGKTVSEVRSQLWQYFSDYDKLVKVTSALQEEVNKFNVGANVAPLKAQAAQLTSDLQRIESQFNGILREQGHLEGLLNGMSVVDKAEIEDRILACETSLSAERHDYEVAEHVSELLAVAQENLSCGYLPRLKKRVSELVAYVTGGAYEVETDRNFLVRLRENGQTKQLVGFSRGIREAVLLCFRIALSELLYDGKIPLMIVDDAFVNYDENNFVRATDLLRKLADNGTQILYFTCHNRLGALA